MIHAEAEAEVLDAIAYYEDRQAGLRRAFREDLEATLDRIRRMPGTFAPIDDQGTRKHRFQRFPYTIYYVELDDVIWIAAIAHQKRRPGYWSRRRLPSVGDP
ncbi:type II toxin-antitoxin system RelE/ParE family toxin [Tautonia rosea]|uniref:type II toxin-antitoxin system RelE/ParE family toxin n=1 Tax=Tautonia rosea TaxID=2728037 RepID=UPI001475404F|nr:type II toxin-antitoxin system RelE/ParE family toxin [Tautonia rosea]